MADKINPVVAMARSLRTRLRTVVRRYTGKPEIEVVAAVETVAVKHGEDMRADGYAVGLVQGGINERSG